MKQLIRKGFLFAFLIIVVQICIWGIVYYLHIQIGDIANEVFYAREIAMKQNTYEKVILGDSVSKQIYNPEFQDENDSLCYLTTNQAITVCGNYLLLHDYIDNNPQTQTVIYQIRPQSLTNDMWLQLTYQYLIIPLCDEEHLQLLDENTVAKMESKFGTLFVHSNLIKRVLLSNNWLFQKYRDMIGYPDEIQETEGISDLSVIYLKKMYQLCEEKGIELKVISSPVADTEENHQLNRFKEDISKYSIDYIFENYDQTIIYIDETEFNDGIHLKESYIHSNREDILNKLLTFQ